MGTGEHLNFVAISCRVCGDDLSGNQRDYCSKKCTFAFHEPNRVRDTAATAPYKKKYALANPDKVREASRIGVLKYRAKMFEILGAECAECGFSDKRALQVDHKHGDGFVHNSHKAGSGRGPSGLLKAVVADPSRFQILCANCNWIKRAIHREFLPRKKRAVSPWQ